MTAPVFNALVLGPGGAKGYLEIGALIKLLESDILKSVKYMVGCSIGAIIGLLYIIDYTPREMIKWSHYILDRLNWRNIDVDTMLDKGGLFDVREIEKTMNALCLDKGFVNPTFSKIYQGTGYDLRIVSTANEIDNPQPRVFSHHTDPDRSIVTTILDTVFIPGFLYDPSNEGNSIRSFVDGAFTNPYPINIFTEEEAATILGVYVCNPLPANTKLEIILESLKLSIVYLRNQLIANSPPNCHHLRLETNFHDTSGLTLDIGSRLKLIFSGYKQTADWLQQYQLHKSKQE